MLKGIRERGRRGPPDTSQRVWQRDQRQQMKTNRAPRVGRK